jgi:hypothetical protein
MSSRQSGVPERKGGPGEGADEWPRMRCGWCLDDSPRDANQLEDLVPAFNWVAIETGLEDDPKLLSFARALKVKRETAFWYVYRWRVLVVLQGTHLTGAMPKKYTAQDIASFVEFRGDACRLVNAMKTAGFIGYKKGRGFFYPGWTDTVTGEYAARREDDRVRKVREREERRMRPLIVQARALDMPGPSVDASLDRPRTSNGNPESDAPPVPPLSGGHPWLTRDGNGYSSTPQLRRIVKHARRSWQRCQTTTGPWSSEPTVAFRTGGHLYLKEICAF